MISLSLPETTNPQSQVPGPDIAISVQNLTKIYKLYDSPMDRLRESLHPLRRKYHHDFFALTGISFEVKKGETVGIIGKNGSGKSTLLKIITDVLTPTSGNVSVDGRVSALLELGTGFNPELTGIENVYFNGMLMGFSQGEMDAKLESILAFADIGEFVNQAVKTYSSGMFVRLAFAVAISVDPDILIVDEALSVGDVFFQQKCYARIRELISKGTTCLFVSHDTTAMMNLCDKAILLNKGVLEFEGAPEEAASRYMSKIGKKAVGQGSDRNFSPLQQVNSRMSSRDILDHSILKRDVTRHGAGGLQITAVRITDKSGIDTLEVVMMEPLQFHLLLKAYEQIASPNVGIHIYDRLGNLVFAASAHQLDFCLPDMEAGQEIIANIEIVFRVQPGQYTFSLGVAESAAEGAKVGFLHDRLEMLGPISVVAEERDTPPFYGIAQLPMAITISNLEELAR